MLQIANVLKSNFTRPIGCRVLAFDCSKNDHYNWLGRKYQTAHQNDGFNALRLYCSKLNPACLCYDSKQAKLHKVRWAIQLLNHRFGLPNQARSRYFQEGSSTVTFILKFFPYRMRKSFEYFFCFHRILGISSKHLEGFCLEFSQPPSCLDEAM